MSIKQKKNLKTWLVNLYYIGTLLTLFFIMAQVFFAGRTMTQSSEWEKAKLTIANIERFKENLKETALYSNTEALIFSDRHFPDFSKPENWNNADIDTLRQIYWSIFEDQVKFREDFQKTLSILDAFAYPIIMGYASEMGSFKNAAMEFGVYSRYIMSIAFQDHIIMGPHAKLLYRLWLYRTEQQFLPIIGIEEIKQNWNNLLLFDGTEFAPASIKQYEKKLDKELKKIQKEINDFRKNSLK